MIEVQGLRKQYGDFVAVDGVSFTAQPGQIFGLLGPNGAGKSTLIGCMSGLLSPTAGSVRLIGRDLTTDGPEAKRHLGVVPQDLAIYEELSATENLSYWGGAYGLRGRELSDRVAEVLAYIGLLDRAKEPTKRYSGGMKRRLNFGCGIVHRPKVLLLDEPTVAIDPQSRERLLDMVQEQADSGATVLYTSHYMEEAERLCDQLVIMDHGKVIAEGTVDELRSMLGERDILRFSGTFEPQRVRQILGERLSGAEILTAEEDTVQVAMEEATHKLPEVFRVLYEAGADVKETVLRRPNLESLFIKLTGKGLRE